MNKLFMNFDFNIKCTHFAKLCGTKKREGLFYTGMYVTKWRFLRQRQLKRGTRLIYFVNALWVKLSFVRIFFK